MLELISKTGKRRAIYRCQCGVQKEILTYSVKSGKTRSCGCLRKQVTSERSTTHGHKSEGKRSKTYIVWVNMKGRCNNPNLPNTKDYMGRGIDYCASWEKFDFFLLDMGNAPIGMSLDRIDNSLGYSKDNCKWATRKQQNNNKRSNVRYEYQGKNKTLTEWGKELGIGRVTLFKRLQRGVDIATAFSNKGYLSINKTLK